MWTSQSRSIPGNGSIPSSRRFFARLTFGHPAQPYRVLHKTHGAAYSTPIDILPFGEIATEAEAFRWPPPDTDLVMNVAAFGDAYGHAMSSLKREANGKVVEMVLKPLKASAETPLFAIGSLWESAG